MSIYLHVAGEAALEFDSLADFVVHVRTRYIDGQASGEKSAPGATEATAEWGFHDE